MEVVVDTNVFIDAWFRGHESAAAVLRYEHQGLYQLVLSNRMREELLGVFAGHLGTAGIDFDDDTVLEAYKRLVRCIHRARLFDPPRIHKFSPDPPDNEFVSCAIEAPADYLVTSNVRHFPTGIKNKAGREIEILRPYDFSIRVLALQTSRKLK